MTTWDELVKNRSKVPTLRNSTHMMKCIREVLAKHPEAKIMGGSTPDLWKLVEMGTDLSGEHNSQYACWAEAWKIMEALK